METAITPRHLYADVKVNFGAYGDGRHDDTKAIQNALDSLKDGGGTIFFPTGVYLISSCLIFYSDQTLDFAEDAVLKRKPLSNSTEPIELRYLMASYTEDSSQYAGYNGVYNVTINGAIFDGNENITSNSKITLLNTCHCSHITIANCSFRNGSVWHCLEVNASRNVRITNCLFDANSYTVMRKDHNELIQLDAAKAGLYGPVFFQSGNEMAFVNDETPCRNVEINNCTFLCCGFAAIGCHSDYPHTDIRIHHNTFSGTPDSRGYIGFTKSVTNVTEYENFYEE